jgi:hypothetical protein
MGYERLWEQLLEFLNDWTTAVETWPGWIEVALGDQDGSPRVVTILMAHDEWDEMVSVPWGDFDSAAQEVRKALLGLRDPDRFLVYARYELVPSASPSLPVDPEDARLDELARRHPEGFGRWAATDRSGNVVDESSPPSE